MPSGLPLTPTGGAVLLSVRLTPRGGRDRVEGIVADAGGAAWLSVRVAAPPEAGRANAALLALLAQALGVPASSVTLVGGAASRRKRVRIAGDALALAARIRALAGTDQAASR